MIVTDEERILGKMISLIARRRRQLRSLHAIASRNADPFLWELLFPRVQWSHREQEVLDAKVAEIFNTLKAKGWAVVNVHGKIVPTKEGRSAARQFEKKWRESAESNPTRQRAIARLMAGGD